jgi:hypothetical protein
MKILLSCTSYIIGSRNERAFCEFLPSATDEVGIDLSETISYCSTAGLLASDPTKDDSFMVKFARDPTPWTFTSEICGGIPAFLALWKEFSEAANIGDSEEDELLLATRAQELLRILLWSPPSEDDPMEVLVCKKRTNASTAE